MKNTNLPHTTKKFKYSVKKMCEAIKKSNGLLTFAARDLGCTYTTIRNYIAKFPEVAQAYEDINETVLDLAENNIRQDLKAGSVETAKWLLRYKGRQRGYIEKETIEIEGAGVSEIPVSDNTRNLGIEFLRGLSNDKTNG